MSIRASRSIKLILASAALGMAFCSGAIAAPTGAKALTLAEKANAIDEIRKLKARYWIGADQRDRALLRSTFADDLVWDATAGASIDGPTKGDPSEMITGSVLHGGDLVTDTLFAMWSKVSTGPVRSIHHGGEPDIDILTATTAKAIWPFVVITRQNGNQPFGIYMIGYYYETYELIDGSWKIKTIKTRPQG